MTFLFFVTVIMFSRQHLRQYTSWYVCEIQLEIIENWIMTAYGCSVAKNKCIKGSLPSHGLNNTFIAVDQSLSTINTKDYVMFGTLPNHHLQLFICCDVSVIVVLSG